MKLIYKLLLVLFLTSNYSHVINAEPLSDWNVQSIGTVKIYTPLGDKGYKVTKHPVKPLNGLSIEHWFKKEIDYHIKNYPVKTYSPSIIFHWKDHKYIKATSRYKDKNGHDRWVYFISEVSKTNRQAMTVVDMNPSNPTEFVSKYLIKYKDMMLNIARLDQTNKLVQQHRKKTKHEVHQKREVIIQKRNKKSNSSLLKKTQYAGRDKGVKLSEIETVLYYEYQTYRSWITLLLKNNWAYVGNLRIPPADFDAKASRKIEPHNWKRWRRNGNKYQALNNKTKKWYNLGGGKIQPNKEGRRLNYNYTYRKASAGWGALHDKREGLILKNNGTFNSYNNFTGSFLTYPPNVKNKKNHGTYTINDGYSINLKTNGKTYRHIFFSTRGKSYKQIFYYNHFYW